MENESSEESEKFCVLMPCDDTDEAWALESHLQSDLTLQASVSSSVNKHQNNKTYLSGSFGGLN